MKISTTRGNRALASARRPTPSTSTSDASVDGIARRDDDMDRVDILGIPSAEFTPRVQQAISELMSEVEDLRSDLMSATKRLRELEDLADLDFLLPIANRRAFVRELNRMISFAERYGTPSTVMFIDMNDLKVINDHYGHEAGDAALRHLARVLSDNIRGTDMVARLGGDEFGVLLAQADEVVSASKASALASVVQSTPMSIDGDTVHLSFAFGTYTFRADDTADFALDQADKAMYGQKREIKGAKNVR